MEGYRLRAWVDGGAEDLTMVEHRRHLDRELEAIEAKVLELFGMVCEDLPGVTEALLNGNNETAERLAGHEQATDALSQEVEQLVGRSILLWAPVASDLRFLISVLRIAPELERSHDLVCHIAARAGNIADVELSPRCHELIKRMSELACDMWRQAMDCWRQRDGFAVPALTGVDNQMDELHASLVAELASGPMTLPVTMEMTLVARFYQRLGDHAANIARRVTYLAGSAGLTGPLPAAG
jgi:phosphate transport system protein